MATSNSTKYFLSEEIRREIGMRYSQSSTIYNLCRDVAIISGVSDQVHIDRKWFFITEKKSRMYLLPGEDTPHCTVKSKRYIINVMFICAGLHPCWGPHKSQWLDRKLRIWPYTFVKPAKLSIFNRHRHTFLTKRIVLISKTVRCKFIIKRISQLFAKRGRSTSVLYK